MTKRFIAFSTALLLFISSFILTSCGSAENDVQEEKIVVENLSAKELFALSAKNIATGGNEISVENYENEGETTFKLDVNKLQIQGEDILDGEKLSVALDYKTDADNRVTEMNASLDIFGENPVFSGVVTADGFYLTDLAGVNDETVLLTYEDMEMNSDGADGPFGGSFDEKTYEEYSKVGDTIAQAVVAAIDKNITDEAYTKEIKDVTVDGKSYAGAVVATLTITSDMAEGVVKDVLTTLGGNEVIAEMFDTYGVNAEELAEDFEFDGVIKIATTVSTEAETVALDIEVTVDGETLAIKYTDIGTSMKITAGFLKENGEFDAESEMGIFNILYSLDGEDEIFTVSITEGEETVEYLSVEGTVKDGVHEGILTISVPDYEYETDEAVDSARKQSNITKYGIKYSLEGDLLGDFKLNISEVFMAQKGITQKVPVDLDIEQKVLGKKIAYKIAFVMELEDIVNVDITLDYAVEYKGVTVEVPTEYIGIDDISEAEYEEWDESLEEKYPKLYDFFNGMGGITGDAYEDNYYEGDIGEF